MSSAPRRTTPLQEGALRQLMDGPGPGRRLLPDSFLPRARRILGLGGWIVDHTRPGGLLGYAARARDPPDHPGAPCPVSLDRIVQWATYLAKTKDLKFTIRQAPPGAEAAIFSDSSTLNGPSPGSSHGGTCQKFSTGGRCRAVKS